jgi:hypothetical protein
VAPSATTNDPREQRTLNHELGHQLGLPDLYRERPEMGDGRDFTGAWCLMGNEQNQQFCGYSRRQLGWIDESRVLTLIPGINPPLTAFTRSVRLGPPGSGLGQADMVRLVNATVGTPIAGLHFEARPRLGLDTNLPADYRPGVLVSRVDPLVVLGLDNTRRVVDVISADSANGSLENAAFPADDVARDLGEGVTLTVHSPPEPNGVHRITIGYVEPPRPDVRAADLQLDSPTNGFGTFLVPELFGDPINYAFVVNWRDNGPFLPRTPILPPEVNPLRHSLIATVSNRGSAPASQVRGTLFVLRLEVPANLNLLDPGTWLPVSLEQFPIAIANLAPGESTRVSFPVRPRGPFAAALLLERNANEAPVMLADNLRVESFAIQFLSFGSPYTPLRVDANVRNMTPGAHSFFLAPKSGLPAGWEIRPGTLASGINPGGSSTLKLEVQPPDPADQPPATSAKQFNLTEFNVMMDLGDAWAPIYTYQVNSILSRPTRIEMECVQPLGKPGRLRGRLLQQPAPNADFAVLPGQWVGVTLSGDDGSQSDLNLKTDAQGRFDVSLDQIPPGVQVSGVASFPGGAGLAPSVSGATMACSAGIADGTPADSPKPRLADIGFRPRQGLRLAGQDQAGVVTLDNPAPSGGLTVRLASSDRRAVRVPSSVTVRAGESSVEFPITIDFRGLPQRSAKITATSDVNEITRSFTWRNPDRLSKPQPR